MKVGEILQAPLHTRGLATGAGTEQREPGVMMMDREREGQDLPCLGDKRLCGPDVPFPHHVVG